MISEISDILTRFESCFTRRAAFSWFVVIIFGLLVRLDQHGVTSLIRLINPSCNILSMGMKSK